MGRWLSADWSAVPAPVPYANLSNPQTLNLYAMVRDNPETFADLDGHEDEGGFGDSGGSGGGDPATTASPASGTAQPQTSAPASTTRQETSSTNPVAKGAQVGLLLERLLERLWGELLELPEAGRWEPPSSQAAELPLESSRSALEDHRGEPKSEPQPGPLPARQSVPCTRRPIRQFKQLVIISQLQPRTWGKQSLADPTKNLVELGKIRCTRLRQISIRDQTKSRIRILVKPVILWRT